MAYEDLTNILPFGKDLYNAMGDAEYRTNSERINGMLGPLADREFHNKIFAQISSVSYTVAQFIASRGYEAKDNDAKGMSENFILALLSILKEDSKDLIPDARIPNYPYSKGDVINDFYMPLWGELECIESGITSSGTLEGLSINAIGQKIQDGTVTWVLRAKKFHLMNGVPVPFSGDFVPYYATNTIIYWIPIHPEIGLPMIDCRFCDGQDLTEYGLGKTIDMRGLILRGADGKPNSDNGECGEEFEIVKGSDSIIITKANLPTNSYSLNLSGTTSEGSHTHTYNAATNASSSQLAMNFNSEGSPAGYPWTYNTANQTCSAIGNHTHNATAEGKIRINASQSRISVVPQHFSLAYIQRIY